MGSMESTPSFLVRARPHAWQFLRYLFSGGMAFVIDFGSFEVMTRLLGVWYVAATMISGLLGFFSAFVLHKYIVFAKKEQTRAQFVRYTILQMFNLLAQTLIVYMMVEYAGAPKEVAKIASIACSVSWNFFLYKFLVYV
jgi:putative flippase GtrA